MTVRSRVIGIIADELALDPKGISGGQNLLTDLGLDSLDGHNVMIGIEEEFEVELKGKIIPDEIFFALKTVDDIIKTVEELL